MLSTDIGFFIGCSLLVGCFAYSVRKAWTSDEDGDPIGHVARAVVAFWMLIALAIWWIA